MAAVLKLQRVKVFQCEKCPKMYASSDKLEEHKLIHVHIFSSYVLLDRTEVFRYKCRTCGHGFQQLRDCRLHELMHVQQRHKIDKYSLNDDNGNIVKPYKCEECGVRFALNSTLVAHSVLHEPFPHLCDCGIGYFREVDFNAHRKTVHHDERTWIPKTSYKRPEPKLEFVVKKRIRKPSFDSVDSFDENIDEYVDSSDRAWRSKAIKTKIGIGPKLKPKGITKNKSTGKKSKRKKPKTEPTDPKSVIKLKTESGEEIDILKNDIGKFACPRCDKSFRSRHNVVTHFRVHTGEKPCACEHCHKRFKHKTALYNHLSIHGLGARNFVCDYCDSGFYAKLRLELHIINEHLGYKPYVCGICRNRFAQRLALNNHLKIHRGIKNFICEYCKKGFLDRFALALHVRTHTGEKPYACKYCGKAFSDPSAFQRHSRTHTGVKPYACKLCPMRFSDASGFIAHKKRHAGDRTKQCDICPKKFYTNSELQIHLVSVHAALRKYECDMCEKTCSQKYNLKVHIERMHRLYFFCDRCRCSFKSKRALEKHMAKVCPKIMNKIEKLQAKNESFRLISPIPIKVEMEE